MELRQRKEELLCCSERIFRRPSVDGSLYNHPAPRTQPASSQQQVQLIKQALLACSRLESQSPKGIGCGVLPALGAANPPTEAVVAPGETTVNEGAHGVEKADLERRRAQLRFRRHQTYTAYIAFCIALCE
jgi:hypothetical protein